MLPLEGRWYCTVFSSEGGVLPRVTGGGGGGGGWSIRRCGPAGEVLAGGGAGEAVFVGRQLLAVAVGAERAVALGAGVAQAAG